jgi:hypothetical protein
VNDSNYWNDKCWPRVMTRRLSRRRLIQIGGMGAAGAMAAAYLGCGGGEQATGDATPSLAESVSPAATVFMRRWFGPEATPGKVQWDGQLETLGADAPDKTTIELTGQNGLPHSSAWVPSVARAYFCTWQNPFALVRFDPATDTYSQYIGSGTATSAWSLCVVEGSVNKVFVAHWTTTYNPIVSVFSTSSDPPALLGSYEYDLGGNNPSETIATDGTYLILGTNSSNVLLILISDMSLKYTLTLSGTVGDCHAAIYCPEDGYFYLYNKNGYVYKLLRTDDALSEVSKYNLVHNCSDCLALTPGYLWLPCEDAVGSVIKIPLSTFNSHAHIVSGPSGECWGLRADSDGEYMWSTWKSDPGVVSRIRISDGHVERVWLSAGEKWIDEIVQCGPHDYVVSDGATPPHLIHLKNLFASPSVQRPTSGSNHSYWVPLRLYVEKTPGVSITAARVYTDGANGLGTGWTAVGGVATDYTEATGAEGVTGDILNTSNYPTLGATPVDISGWTAASPKAIDGSLANPDIGDVGVAGTDECFMVLQLVAAPTVAPGLSNQETLTITYSDGSAPMSKTASIRGEASIPAVAS